MPDLTVLPGGGESDDRYSVTSSNAVEICTICGVPHRGPCRLLGRHLRHLELLGRSPLTVYERKRMITRLGAWLSHSPVTNTPRRGQNVTPDVTSGCGRPSALRPVCVADATPEQLYAWRESLRVADATVACYMSSVRGFYAWMAAEGLRDDDPAAKIPVPVTPRRLPRPISEQDLMRALDAAPDRIRLMLVLMGWGGLRCKEIANLRRENIRDTAENPVVVIVHGASKGRKERAIPMNDFVVAEVRDARPPLPRTGYVFPRHDAATAVFYGNQHRPGWGGGRAGPLSPWMVSRLIGEHLHGLGIAATAHMCRHRYGTQAYAVSEDLIAVRDLMGHAHISTTSGYVEVAGKKGRDIVSKLPVPPKLRVVKDSDTA